MKLITMLEKIKEKNNYQYEIHENMIINKQKYECVLMVEYFDIGKTNFDVMICFNKGNDSKFDKGYDIIAYTKVKDNKSELYVSLFRDKTHTYPNVIGNVEFNIERCYKNIDEYIHMQRGPDFRDDYWVVAKLTELCYHQGILIPVDTIAKRFDTMEEFMWK